MYDGVVTIADDDIPVIVELDETRIRMSAGGTEIGEWPTDECQISHVSESTYSISAENETLRFVPNQPRLFAAAVSGGAPDVISATPSPVIPAPERELHQPPEAESPPDQPQPSEMTTEQVSPPEPVMAPAPELAHVAMTNNGETDREAPPPQPLTMGLFYALCVLTAGLAVWSLITIVF